MADLGKLVLWAALATTAACAKAGPENPGTGGDDAPGDSGGVGDGAPGDGDPMATSCGAPQAPTNGTVNAPTTNIGDTATYACDTGFILTGSATATCQATGTWTMAPACVAGAACTAPPPAPLNGTVSAPQLASGSVASYACGGAYILLKSQVSACINGTWVGGTPQCATRIGCVCSGEFVQGEAIYAATANPGGLGMTGLAAGSTGNVLAGNAGQPSFELLTQWNGWHEGISGNCAAVDCGPCSNSGDSKWYLSCTQVATPRLRCACGGAFTEGDRVVALANAPSGATGVSAGQLGTVIAGTTGKILVQWDGYTGGHDGQCATATCGRCAPSGTARAWVACAELGRGQ